jgi:RNA polymerase sigma-70 factor, ECF subfamily
MTSYTNDEWLSALREKDNSSALEELRTDLAHGLHYALAEYTSGDALEGLVDDTALEATLKITANLDTFRGECRFMTWAMKIAVRLAFSELRRKHWQEVSLDDLLAENEDRPLAPFQPFDPTPDPEIMASRDALLEKVETLLVDELTPRQRQALLAVSAGIMPLDEIARRLGTNRNALYKMIHDARKRLHKRMVVEGLSVSEILASFADR